MLPYIFFSVISAIAEIVVGRISPNSPFNSPLWFLQTLFVSLLLYSCASQKCSKMELNILCVGIMVLSYIGYKYTDVSNVLPFGLFRAINAFVFIHIGVMLKRVLQQKMLLRNIICCFSLIVLYCGSLMFTMSSYDTLGANYVSGKLFTISLVLPWILSVSGSVAVIYVCLILSSVRPINWLGRNSLVIMCVHFPLTERLNVFLSSTFLYQKSYGKLILAGTELFVVLVFCYIMIVMCKKYVPQFSGYKKTFLTK